LKPEFILLFILLGVYVIIFFLPGIYFSGSDNTLFLLEGTINYMLLARHNFILAKTSPQKKLSPLTLPGFKVEPEETFDLECDRNAVCNRNVFATYEILRA
jgi:hypothetical protein